MAEDKPWFFVVTVIMAIISLILIVTFTVSKVKPAAEASAAIAKCEQSVAAHAAFTTLANRPPIHCPIVDHVIDYRDQERLKKEIADSMKDCWRVYGEGKKDLFDRSDGLYCVPCAVFHFQEKQQLTGLYHYLLTRKAKGDKTYYDYFQGESSNARNVLGTIEPRQLQELEDQTLVLDRPYATMLFYAKGFDSIEVFEKNMAAFGATWGGSVAGAALGFGLMKIGVGLIAVPVPFARLVAGTAIASGFVLANAGDVVAKTKNVLQAVGILDYEKAEWTSYIYFAPYEKGMFDKMNCKNPVIVSEV